MKEYFPPITKDEIKKRLYVFELYYDYFDKCIEYGELDFYDYITFSEEDYSFEISDEQKPDYVDASMMRSINDIYLFNNEIVSYLRSEPKSYQDYFRTELIPKHIERLHKILSREDIELTIFRFEIDSDTTYDIYKNLNCLYQIFTNIEQVIEDNVALKTLLDYRINSTELEIDKENKGDEEEEFTPRKDAIMWHGTATELAALMGSLADNGYINPPLQKNGERNNQAFMEIIQDHYKLHDGSFRTLVNSLRDNPLTPDNRFKIAMNKIPQNSKK